MENLNTDVFKGIDTLGKGLDEKDLTGEILNEFQWSFCNKNKWDFMGFILLSLIVVPIQFTFIPKSVAGMTKSLVNIGEKELSSTDKKNILWGISILIIAWIVVTALQMGKSTIELSLVPKHIQHIRVKLFDHLLQRYSNEYDDIPAGESIVRILDISKLFAYQSQYVLTRIIPYIIGLIVVIVYAFTVNRTLGCIILVGLLLVTANVSFFAREISHKSNQREGTFIKMAQKMNEKFDNLMHIYVNNEQQNALEDYEDLNQDHTNKWQNEMTTSRNCKALITCLTVLTFAVVLFVGYHKVKNKRLSGFQFASLITVFVVYMNRSIKMFMFVPYFARMYGVWSNSVPFVKNIFDHAERKHSDKKILKGSIDFVDVNFHYADESIKVFNKFNMNIKENERVAIMGRSGSGKSTMMKLILGLYRPTNGIIKIGGHDMRRINLEEIRKKVTYINQRTNLMNDSILKNIQYGNDSTAEEINNILEKYNLTSVYSDIGGIESNTGVNGGNLSLGMQKLTILLRGVLRKGSLIYLIDEPLSGLDANTRKNVTNMINDTLKDRTIVYVTHNDEIMQFVDRVIQIT
jgi:ABC-type multidrug transport system fused ATPase/permease subunit